MKILYIVFVFIFIPQGYTQVSADQVEMARVKCELIKCDKLTAQEYYRCRVQEKNCYKRVFDMNMQIWKKDGVSQKQRSSIIQTLEQSKKSHRQLVDRLNEEIKVAQKEILEIDLKIEAVKSLSGQR
jgi:hypothetical protein